MPWRLYYPGGSLDEPPHPVSIRENAPGAVALEAITPLGQPLKRFDLRGGWLPLWVACTPQPQLGRPPYVVFGRALVGDNGVVMEVSAATAQRLYEDVPNAWLDDAVQLALRIQALVR